MANKFNNPFQKMDVSEFNFLITEEDMIDLEFLTNSKKIESSTGVSFNPLDFVTQEEINQLYSSQEETSISYLEVFTEDLIDFSNIDRAF